MPLRPLIRFMRLMELIMGVVGQGELPAIAPHAAGGGGKKEEYFARFLMDGNEFFIENSNRKQTSQERRIIS